MNLKDDPTRNTFTWYDCEVDFSAISYRDPDKVYDD